MNTPFAPPKAPKSGSNKRERILAAAEIVFAKHGFFHARIAEIAKVAGIADGTLYLYFKSKDDLLIHWFESRMERVNQALSQAIDHVSEPHQKLIKFIDTHLELVVEQPNVAEVFIVELRQSSKFMKEVARPRFAEFLKKLTQIITEGQRAGQFQASLPTPLVARAIFGMLNEVAFSWLLGKREKFDLRTAAQWIGTLTLHGLAGTRERTQQ